MADNNQNNTDWLGNLKGAIKEANKLSQADKQRRLQAEKKPDSIILTENELRTGQWDSSKVLKTTLGLGSGEAAREITPADLANFKKEVDRIQKVFKKGIKAEQVIDLSRKIDRQRARDEIKNAVILNALNGTMRFITNASGKTPKVVRHHVEVEFNKKAFISLASSGNSTPKEAALALRKGYLSFDCDCGRHVYWGYKYMATIGGYNCGKREEKGYPKIRNSELRGVACKHVIRVMSEIMSSSVVLATITEMMKRAKAHAFNKAQIRNSQKEAEKAIEEQNKRKTDKIDTQADKARTKRAKQRLKQIKANQAKKVAAALSAIPPTKKRERPPTKKQVDQSLDMIANSDLTPEQITALIMRLRAAQQGNG